MNCFKYSRWIKCQLWNIILNHSRWIKSAALNVILNHSRQIKSSARNIILNLTFNYSCNLFFFYFIFFFLPSQIRHQHHKQHVNTISKSYYSGQRQKTLARLKIDPYLSIFLLFCSSYFVFLIFLFSQQFISYEDLKRKSLIFSFCYLQQRVKQCFASLIKTRKCSILVFQCSTKAQAILSITSEALNKNVILSFAKSKKG